MIHVVMVRPENSGNIGAVARVMKNFGVGRLILVDPAVRINEESRRRAKHAADVLRNAVTASWDIVGTMDLVVGTSSKVASDYNIARSSLSPAGLAGVLPGRTRVALLLGPEGNGLSNMEIGQCDVVVTIPTAKGYPSMNISHALAVLLYELTAAGQGSRAALAEKREKAVISSLLSSIVDMLEYRTEEKKSAQIQLWKRLLGKSMLTRRESFALIGFFRKVKNRL